MIPTVESFECPVAAPPPTLWPVGQKCCAVRWRFRQDIEHVFTRTLTIRCSGTNLIGSISLTETNTGSFDL